MKEKLMNILEEIRPDIDFINETKLIDNGLLDSFDIVSLVQELNENFDISVSVDELVPHNFNSIENMIELINSKK